MAELSLFLLGPTRVQLNETDIEIKPRKALALLIYLALGRERHSRDYLATLLWPNSDYRRARRSLRNRLSELNRALGGDWIEADRQSIGLQAGFWLDVTEFQRNLAQGTGNPQALVAAVDLYRDDFLAGFTLPDCPQFDEWQFFQRESLRQALASALERLVSILSSRNDYETAVPYARRWLALDPLHEPAHYQLVQLYAQAGQRTAALRHYDQCRQTLENELGISPSPETRALYEDIKAGRAIGRNRRSRPRHNLPVQTTTFIGRETEVADIKRLLLEERGCRLVTLVGPGGIGKTRLALAAATQTLDAFSDGTFFVSLVSISEVEFIVPAIAEALSFTFSGSADPRRQLLNHLRQKQLLLVVDNFEHLLDGANLLARILIRAPAITLLTTSRQPLDLREEWLYEVQGLRFPEGSSQASEFANTFASTNSYSAVELFSQRARQIDVHFAPSAAEAAAIGRICQLVDGMPLGIELAAPWIRTLSCGEIATKIERTLDFLTSSLRNIPERHRSLRAVFEQTWEGLTSEEQAILQRLSVFRGGCTREAAEQVAGATPTLLSSLVDKALLRRTNRGQYELHALLSQFATEKLLASPDNHKRTLHHYCRYYAALLHGYELENKRDLASTVGTLSNTLADWRNIQAAWRQTLAYPLISEIGQFAYFLSLFYYFRGLVHQGEETFSLARAHVETHKEAVSPIVLVRVLTHYSFFCMSLTNLEQARELLEEALALSSALDEEVHGADIGLMLHFLAWVTRLQGHPAKASGYLQQSMAACERANYQLGVWMCTCMKGELEYDAGNYDSARHYYEQGLSLSKNTQYVVGILDTLVLLGNVYSALADNSRAADCLRQALMLSRDLSVVAPVFTGVIGIAALFGRQGQHDLALELSVVTLHHPQCNVVAQHKARIMIRELLAHTSDDQLKMVTDNVERGQLTNPYIEPNFTVDAEFIDRLLEMIDRATDRK